MTQTQVSSNTIKCARSNEYNLIKSIYEKYDENKFKIFLKKDLIKQSKSNEEINKNGYYTTIIGFSYKDSDQNEYFNNIDDLSSDDINTLLVLGLLNTYNRFYYVISKKYYICSLNVIVSKNLQNNIVYKFEIDYYNEYYRRFKGSKLFEQSEGVKELDNIMSKYLDIKQTEYLARIDQYNKQNELITKLINNKMNFETINEFNLDLKDKDIIFKPINKTSLYDKYGKSIIYYYNKVVYVDKSGYSDSLKSYKLIIAIQNKDKIYNLNDIVEVQDSKYIIPCVIMYEHSKLVSYEYLFELDKQIKLINYKKFDSNDNKINEDAIKIIDEITNKIKNIQDELNKPFNE